MTNLLSLTQKALSAAVLLLALTASMSHSGNAARAQNFDMTSINRAAGQVALGAAIAQTLNGADVVPAPTNTAKLPITSTGVYNLTVVSTGSVNLNSCDMPFLRSNGGSGAFPSAGGGGGGTGGGGGSGGGDVGLPNLPPGYVGVQNTHTGAFMGAIPPGGNIVDFFRGAYGIQPGQEAEADYILHNQLQYYWQNGIFAGMWGPYEQSGPP
ncbi:MAG: hypothetical protein JST01_05450 [Cyanobacteria bacterium SZAS TMP-1]|nr:hypothetical protein [Cyanobacteria bacterium SZAS TMP-1]